MDVAARAVTPVAPASPAQDKKKAGSNLGKKRRAKARALTNHAAKICDDIANLDAAKGLDAKKVADLKTKLQKVEQKLKVSGCPFSDCHFPEPFCVSQTKKDELEKKLGQRKAKQADVQKKNDKVRSSDVLCFPTSHTQFDPGYRKP